MKSKFTLRSFLLAAGSSLLAISSASAQSGTWDEDANGTWSTATNWFSDVIATGSGNTANFTNDITADRIVSLDADRTLTNVIFGDNDTATAGSWVLDNNGLSTNNLNLAGTTPTITVNTLGTGKTAEISAIITGSAGLTKAGDGTLILSNTNTYSGNTVISAGTLQVGNGGTTGIATGTISIANGARLVIKRSDGITPGVISGQGSVTLTTSSTLTLSNSNSFSGGFTLNGGQVGGLTTGTYNGFGTGLLTINGGSLRGPNTTSAIVIPNNVAWNANVGFGRAQGGAPNFTFNGDVTLGASVAASTASGSDAILTYYQWKYQSIILWIRNCLQLR